MFSFSRSLVFCGLMLFSTACSESNAPAAPPTEYAAVAKAYNLPIVTKDPTFPVKTSHGEINGKAASADELRAYEPIFVAEFSLYPTDFVKRSKLKQIVLCKDLSFAGELRTAIPDYEHDVLYYDVVRGFYNKNYTRKVIHHEFFHVIDYKDDGQVYTDERWAKLNRKDFKYGSGGTSAQATATTSVLTDKYPGFLNHYSTTGVEEDKAEVFANLIVDHGYVDDRIKNDAVLKAKVTRMHELTAKFSPEMTVDFWKKARALKRGE